MRNGGPPTAALLALLGLSACSTGGPPAPDHCSLKVVALEEYENSAEGPTVAYRVRGVAGSAGKVWIAGRARSGAWISGYGVDVGPGPFEVIVDLKLTGPPEQYSALLEVAGRRCKTNAPRPGG